jgi:mannose-6-phosphate isomerase-like protein (cupin superfamily)
MGFNELVQKRNVCNQYIPGIHYIDHHFKKIGVVKSNYPHTIDNGGGEEITFVQFINDDKGGKLEIHNRVQPGAGPPMHVHFLQDESLTVVSGKIGAQIEGQAPFFAGPGQTVTFKRGEVHKFWNAGEDILICKGWAVPAYNLEYFLTEIYRSVKSNGGHRPSTFDSAYLLSRYKTEFDMNEIPLFVKKVVFPIVRFFGILSGKHKKFAEAPPAFGK